MSEDNDPKYNELKHLRDDQVKQLSEQEELKLRLIEQQLEDLAEVGDDQSKLEEEKERIARQNEQLVQQIKDRLPSVCDQLLKLRLFLVESEGDEQLIRFGQSVKQKLQQLNHRKPNLNRLISELLVRNSHDSDVKLVHLAKSMYGRKLMELLEQLQVIGEICSDCIEFLKTKLYGGFLLRKTINEMNVLTNEIERSTLPDPDCDDQTASVDKSELDLVKQMLRFDFNGDLTRLKTLLNDHLQQFDDTADAIFNHDELL